MKDEESRNRDSNTKTFNNVKQCGD